MTRFVWLVEFTANLQAVESGFRIDEAVLKEWTEDSRTGAARVDAAIVSGPESEVVLSVQRGAMLARLIAQIKRLRRAQRELSGTLHTPALEREKTREIEALTHGVDSLIADFEAVLNED